MPNLLYRKNLISIADLNVNELQLLLDTALQLKQQPRDDLLAGKLIASCFFEPSTRTRLSFETAVQRLGGKVIGFPMAQTPARKKAKRSLTPRVSSAVTPMPLFNATPKMAQRVCWRNFRKCQ